MTTRPAAEDHDLLLDALEQEPGNDTLSSSLSPALQAELQGLRAVRRLLNEDTAFGVASGADLPPAHLFDAILRAEVAARPDAIRQAIVAGTAAAAPNSTTTKPAWWQRLSSWMVGGGVLTAAAAALLINVQRSPELQNEANLVMPEAAAPAVAPPPPAPMPADALGFAADKAAVTMETTASGDVVEGRLGKPREMPEAKARAPAPEGAKDNAVAAEEMADGRAGLGASGGGSGRGDVAGAASDQRRRAEDSFADDSLADESLAEKATVVPTMKRDASAPAPVARDAADSDAAVVPPTEPAPPAVKSGAEIRRVFQERLAAKQEARRESAGPAKAKSAPPKSASPSAPSSSAAARSRSFDELERDRQAQEANGILVTAENELSRGRFAIAVDLAQRAEAAAAGTLGLAPASTLARGFLGLKRPADAARVGSRLLSGDVADAQIVDGLLAAAQAALQIGDRPLATRLVQHALAPANTDVARRARAQALLTAIRAEPAVPAAATTSDR